MAGPKQVLVVAAHPDDEVLGCGGTVARHAAAGDEVHVVIAAEGATARDSSRDTGARRQEINSLRDAAQAAAKVLGSRVPEFLGLPDNRLDGLDLLDVVKPIEDVVAAVRPAIVYTHAPADLNIDHRIVHEAVLIACRPLPDASVRRIFAFETPSSTEWGAAARGGTFQPRRFVDISDTLETKLAALECYGSEMREFPHARSLRAIRALAEWRGASAGLAAAEAFEVIREIA